MRNPIYNLSGTIDCEIEISPGDWVPFTASPNDVGLRGWDIYADALAAGPAPYVAPVIPVITLAQARAAMRVTPLQGILTLGEARWAAVLAFRDGTNPDLPPASWAQKIIIDSAENWERLSVNMQFMGWVLGYGPEEMDQLFIDAAQVTS